MCIRMANGAVPYSVIGGVIARGFRNLAHARCTVGEEALGVHAVERSLLLRLPCSYTADGADDQRVLSGTACRVSHVGEGL